MSYYKGNFGDFIDYQRKRLIAPISEINRLKELSDSHVSGEINVNKKAKDYAKRAKK